jgi:hypothetical protein
VARRLSFLTIFGDEMNKRSSLIFIFFFIGSYSGVFAMEPEQPEEKIEVQEAIVRPRPKFVGLKNVTITQIEELPSTIRGERFKTRVYIKGLEHPLFYRGKLLRFSPGVPGAEVSIIYEIVELHGYQQSWIHLMDTTDLNTLTYRWQQGESLCRSEQQY